MADTQIETDNNLRDKIYRSRHYALAILVVVYTFNFIDRQILALLLPSIKAEFDLSDFQLGLLSGTVFVIFYATLGIPIARYADRSNRRNLVSIAIAVWSFFTAISGLAQNFWHLLLARIGVGVGEAGCSPPAHSMIADYYPQEQRATALGIYSLGIPLGIMFGAFAGGWIVDNFNWRIAFFVVGIPGIFMAFIVRFFVAEPPRGLVEQRQAQEQPRLAEALKELAQKRTFWHMSFAAGLAAFVGYGFIYLAPTFLYQSYGMAPTDIGIWFGLILGIPGGLGIVLGGFCADRLGRRKTEWYLWTTAIALAASVPLNYMAYMSDTSTLTLLWLVVPVFLGNFYQATVFSQTQGIVSLRVRALAAGILFFIINMIGLGLGPPIVGLVSDFLNPRFGTDSLRYALLICGFVYLWAALHFYFAGKHLKNDLVSEDAA